MENYHLLAIDAGTTTSGVCEFNNGKIISSDKAMPNGEVLEMLRENKYQVVAFEMISSYGMPVGRETFETILWIGQFIEAANWTCEVRVIPRYAVKHHWTGKTAANDSIVRGALFEIFGDKGTKKNPGFFYGVVSHALQAAAAGLFVLSGARHATGEFNVYIGATEPPEESPDGNTTRELPL